MRKSHQIDKTTDSVCVCFFRLFDEPFFLCSSLFYSGRERLDENFLNNLSFSWTNLEKMMKKKRNKYRTLQKTDWNSSENRELLYRLMPFYKSILLHLSIFSLFSMSFVNQSVLFLFFFFIFGKKLDEENNKTKLFSSSRY